MFLKLIVSDKGVEDLRILWEGPNYVEHKLRSFNLYSCFLTLSIPYILALNGKLSLPKSRRCLAICDESLLRLINQKSDGRRRCSSAVFVELEKMAANLTYFEKKK